MRMKKKSLIDRRTLCKSAFASFVGASFLNSGQAFAHKKGKAPLIQNLDDGFIALDGWVVSVKNAKSRRK